VNIDIVSLIANTCVFVFTHDIRTDKHTVKPSLINIPVAGRLLIV
jgi:hypothetical protein